MRLQRSSESRSIFSTTERLHYETNKKDECNFPVRFISSRNIFIFMSQINILKIFWFFYLLQTLKKHSETTWKSNKIEESSNARETHINRCKDRPLMWSISLSLPKIAPFRKENVRKTKKTLIFPQQKRAEKEFIKENNICCCWRRRWCLFLATLGFCLFVKQSFCQLLIFMLFKCVGKRKKIHSMLHNNL